MPQVSEQQLVNLAVAMVPHVSGVAVGTTDKKARIEQTKLAYLESLESAEVFLADLTLERVTTTTTAGPSDLMKQEVVWQRWEQVT